MERLALRDWGRFIARAALRVGDAWRRHFLMGLGGTGTVPASDSHPRGWACGWSCDDTTPGPRRSARIHVTVRHGDRLVGQFEFEAAHSEDVDATQFGLVNRLSDFLIDHLMQLG